MSREERKLRKHLEEHTRREQRKANKHLSKIRAGEPKPPRERMDVRAVDSEEIHPPPVKKRTRNESGVPASAARGPRPCPRENDSYIRFFVDTTRHWTHTQPTSE